MGTFSSHGAAICAFRPRSAVTLVGLLAAVASVGGCPEREQPKSAEPTQRVLSSLGKASSGGIKLATWNLALLPKGKRKIRRSDADYAKYGSYAASLDADVIALQEVVAAKAARRVFDPDRYEVVLSTERNSQRTGFAIKRDIAARGFSVDRNPDLAALDVGGLRRGTDITLTFGEHKLRLLSVHLKSGCFDDDIESPSKACRKLQRQVPVLEKWIDARASEGTPFAILGDFNRRFDAPGDAFWPEIDDGQPPGADLTRATEGQTSRCWGNRYPRFIDHIVVGQRAAAWLDAASFREHLYGRGKRVSDHCALTVQMTLPSPPIATAQPSTPSGSPPASGRRPPSAGGPTTAAAPSTAVPPPADASSPTTAQPTAAAPPTPQEGGIKGNINKRGRKLYHRPDCPAYEDTVIDEARGERWFASEKEAQKAGWTEAKNCP